MVQKGAASPSTDPGMMYMPPTVRATSIWDSKYFELGEAPHRELLGRGRVSPNSSPRLAADVLYDLDHSLPLHKTFVSLSGQREDCPG